MTNTGVVVDDGDNDDNDDDESNFDDFNDDDDNADDRAFDNYGAFDNDLIDLNTARPGFYPLKRWCENCENQILSTGSEFPPGSEQTNDIFICKETTDAILSGLGAIYEAVDKVCYSTKKKQAKQAKEKGKKESPLPSRKLC